MTIQTLDSGQPESNFFLLNQNNFHFCFTWKNGCLIFGMFVLKCLRVKSVDSYPMN